jgi:hypothetical protein
VLTLDADEVLPPEAEAEIGTIVTSSGSELNGYWINRRFWFMGKWLRHAYYPNWNLRLFKHRLGRYEKLTEGDTASGDNEVHEHVVVPGRTGRLKCELDHYAFPSVDVFVEKHNRYSNWEARVAIAGTWQSDARQSNARVSWRRTLKRVSRHLPCRPWLRFLYVYVWQGGFWDGREGYYFARLHAYYEFLSVAKTYELKRAGLKSSPTEAANTAAGETTKWAVVSFFWSWLTVVLFFALRPSPQGQRSWGLPKSFARWVRQNDEWSNLIAFTTLAVLMFWPDVKPAPGDRSIFARLAEVGSNRWVRLALFFLLVLTLETAQLWIPGRVFDWKDIAMGWVAGVVGMLGWKLTRRQQRNEVSD